MPNQLKNKVFKIKKSFQNNKKKISNYQNIYKII